MTSGNRNAISDRSIYAHLELPVHHRLLDGVVLPGHLELNVLDVLGQGHEIRELLLALQSLHRVLPDEGVGQVVLDEQPHRVRLPLGQHPTKGLKSE